VPALSFIVRIAAFACAAGGIAPLAMPQGDRRPPTAPERFTVRSDNHPMAVWARKPAAPRGVILLVHGRTWSSRPDFDLQVPGMDRSVMASLAAHGFAAYAVDLRGYGETPRDATGWLTPKRAVTDIVNVVTWLAAQHPKLPKPAIVGWSRGAIMAGMAALAAPAQVSSVVLFGFASDPELKFVDLTEPGAKPQRTMNTSSAAESDFISPAVTPRAVITAFVQQALRADPFLVDLKDDGDFNAFDPAKLTTPTLVLYGSADPGVDPGDAGKMFAKIAATDKQMVVLPGADHAAQLEDTHDAWIAAVVNFISRPGPRR
jgi:pimeloyl-ACP methyl ester carboxylesterase